MRQVQNVVNEIETGLSQSYLPAQEITKLLGGMVQFSSIIYYNTYLV